MSKLNKDILFLLFKELKDDSKSLFSCLMVNKLWCETVIPILWKNPWRYNINYYKKSSLYYIITFYLTDDIKKILESQGIQLPQSLHKSLLFDYLSFCKSINVNIIRSIIYFGYPFDYCKFLLEQELYNILIRKCSELKYLDIRSIEHQIFYFPEAKVRLDSLCELKCDTSIDPSYFYGLSCICNNIQRLIIVNTVIKKNPGIVKFIEVQNNLKYFEWEDNYNLEDFFDGPYGEIFLKLEKKADTLNYLIMFFQCFYEYEHKILQKLLPELHKLKTLKINYNDIDLVYFGGNLKALVYHDLEIFNIDYISIDTAAHIVENSKGKLREILFLQEPYYDVENDDSLILIRKIYENCPLVENLSLAFPPIKEHFTELKRLLKVCQNLKSLLLLIRRSSFDYEETQENMYKNGDKLLEILIESSPMNLREIRFFNDFRFSLKALETFLKKWKGPPLSIFTSDDIYNGEDYVNLINRYKNINGIIKGFTWKVYNDLYKQ